MPSTPALLVYLLPILVTLAATAAMFLAARRPRGISVVRFGLAGVLSASEVVELAWPAVAHHWSPASNLPLQLSDAATLVAIAAMIWPSWRFAILTYFWGLPAGVLALAFPAVGANFPSPSFIAFYTDHGCLVLAALIIWQQHRPLPLGDSALAWVATIAMALVAATGNRLTGGDYMFLRRPPPSWSPLDLMGTWPWYVVSAAAVAAVLFCLMALPWRRRHPAPRVSMASGRSERR